MVSSNIDDKGDASNGLDLLFAASQLTSIIGGGGDYSHQHHPVMPVNDFGYLHVNYENMTMKRNIAAITASSSDADDLSSIVRRSQTSKSFAQILMDILNTHDNDPSIICWLPDGLSFLIADHKRFEKELLPKHFRGSLFNSFVRKLNRWGFRRLKRSGQASSFAHDLFIRDKPWLCARMKCHSKPNFRKVTAKVNDDIMSHHAHDSATDVATSPNDDNLQDAATPTVASVSPSLLHNMVVNNVIPSNSNIIQASPVNVTNIPSTPSNMEEQLRRNFLFTSASQLQQQIHEPDAVPRRKRCFEG